MLRIYLSKIFLILALIFTTSAQAETSFSQIYIFGDSLSDTGNLVSVTGPLPPPYDEKRVSNGPVAVERLAARLGLTAEASLYPLSITPEAGSNYAVASARAARPTGDLLQDLSSQITAFIINNSYSAPSDALYVVMIGGNDIRSTRNITDIDTAQAIVQEAVASVFDAIQNLTLVGAQSFLLINAPNVGLIPETRIISELSADPDMIKRARKMSNLYRQLLHDMAVAFEETSNVEISEFDLFKFFTKVIQKPDDYGFINSTDACFSTITLSFHPDCFYGQNANQFVFFDEIHPTTTAHTLFGNAFYEKLIKQVK